MTRLALLSGGRRMWQRPLLALSQHGTHKSLVQAHTWEASEEQKEVKMCICMSRSKPSASSDVSLLGEVELSESSQVLAGGSPRDWQQPRERVALP